MKTYKVTLFQKGYELCPYVQTVEAKSLDDATEKAKEIVAKIGWWGTLESKPIEEKTKLLVVKSIELINE